MASSENRSAVVPAVIVGLCLVVGLAVGGHFVGQGAAPFRSDVRIVTVKGLVEREVKADQAIWTLGLRRASESLQDAHARISADRDAAVAFLRKQGFAEGEIERQPTRTVDKLAREYGQPQAADRFRYVVTTSVVVKTPDVDLVRTAVGATEELLRAGVILDGEREGAANPRYVVSKFNDLRPQLLADATRNARATAQQFAADSGAQVGVIRSANRARSRSSGWTATTSRGRSARPARR
jgi:uncharacterized protein